MGQTKSNLRHRSFKLMISQEEDNDDLPTHIQRLLQTHEEEKFYYTKDIFVASQENAERAPPCSGGQDLKPAG